MQEKILFAVEDEEDIREIIQCALATASIQVKTFETAEEMLLALEKETPSLILLDIMLPGMDGMSALTKIRKTPRYSKIPVIMLTAKGTEVDKVKGLDAGADDYITKPFGIMELSARVRALLRRQAQPESYVLGDLTLNPSKHEVLLSGKKLDLTPKEYELLLMLFENRDRVVPRSELLDKIWGFDFEGETRTLDAHVKSLRTKIHDNADNSRYIKTIRSVGYTIESQEEFV